MRNFNSRSLNHLTARGQAAAGAAHQRYTCCSGDAPMTRPHAAVIRFVTRTFMSRRNFTLLLAFMMASSGCSWPSVSSEPPAPSEEQISFLSIVLDEDTAVADTRLRKFLERAVSKPRREEGQRPLAFQQQTMPYGDVIRAFTDNAGRGQVARITPYAYVAAEMLGAKLNVLAIYRSVATEKTTYHSYFVVRRDDLIRSAQYKPETGEPTLEHVKEYLRVLSKQNPARF